MKRFNIVVNGRAYDVQVDEMAPGAPAPAPVPAAMPSAIPSPVPSPVGYAAKSDRSHVVLWAKELSCQFVFLRPLASDFDKKLWKTFAQTYK